MVGAISSAIGGVSSASYLYNISSDIAQKATEEFSDILTSSSESAENTASAGGAKGSGGAQSSSSEDENYDPMDLNKDGTVTPDEVLAYMKQQQTEKIIEQFSEYLEGQETNSDNQIGGLNSKKGLEKYQNNETQFNAYSASASTESVSPVGSGLNITV